MGGGEPGYIVLCSTGEKGATTTVNVAKKYPAFKGCNATLLWWRGDSQKIAFRALDPDPYRPPHGQYLASLDGALEAVDLKKPPKWMRDRLAGLSKRPFIPMVQTGMGEKDAKAWDDLIHGDSTGTGIAPNK